MSEKLQSYTPERFVADATSVPLALILYRDDPTDSTAQEFIQRGIVFCEALERLAVIRSEGVFMPAELPMRQYLDGIVVHHPTIVDKFGEASKMKKKLGRFLDPDYKVRKKDIQVVSSYFNLLANYLTGRNRVQKEN